MGKKKIIFILVLITAVAWVAKFTANVEQDNEKYVDNLIKLAESNEKNELYKKNIDVYLELIEYEASEKWYEKLRDTYLKIEKYDEYLECAEIIFDYNPSNKENTRKLFEFYSDNGMGNSIMQSYEKLSEEMKEEEFYHNIFLSCASQIINVSGYFNNFIGFVNNNFIFSDDNGKQYFGDTNGNLLFDKGFEKAECFYEDLAAVKKDGKWMYIDMDGDKCVHIEKQIYSEMHSFSEGYAVVCENNKYGYIDQNGKEYSIKYDYASAFFNGVATVKDGDKWYIIGRDMKKIADTSFEDVIVNDSDICNSLDIIFAKKNGKYNMYNLQCEKISETSFEDCKLFLSDGVAAVKNEGKWGFVDTKGKKILDYKYDAADSFRFGIAAVRIGDVYEYIYKDGTQMTNEGFTYASILNKEGKAFVGIGEQYKIITFAICGIENDD